MDQHKNVVYLGSALACKRYSLVPMMHWFIDMQHRFHCSTNRNVTNCHIHPYETGMVLPDSRGYCNWPGCEWLIHPLGQCTQSFQPSRRCTRDPRQQISGCWMPCLWSRPPGPSSSRKLRAGPVLRSQTWKKNKKERKYFNGPKIFHNKKQAKFPVIFFKLFFHCVLQGFVSCTFMA